MLAAVAAQGVEDVSGEALGVDAHDRGLAVDVAHDEGHSPFDAPGGDGNRVVAGLGVVDNALEAENAEVSPAGRKICIGYLADGRERHGDIIRFCAHKYWILLGMSSMQAGRMTRKVGV